MHPGQGPGLSLHDLGETGGSETVTLLESRFHRTTMRGASEPLSGWIGHPSANRWPPGVGGNPCTVRPAVRDHGSDNTLTPAGGDQSHNNMQPYLTLNFCIALQGVFPPRT